MLISSHSQLYHLSISINCIIKQCKTINQLKQIHAHSVAKGLISHNTCSSQILTKLLYSLTTKITHKPSSSLLHYAVSIFTTIQNPSKFSYNIIIRLHILHSSPHSALQFFLQMRRSSVLPDFHTYPFALKACANIGNISLAQSLHCQLLKFGFLSDLYVTNSLIHLYSLSNCLSDAHQVFDESSDRDVVSFNAMIDGFVKGGDLVQARAVFDRMPVRDSVSWGTLVSGYAQGSCCVEAIELFDLMMDLKVVPDNIALVSVLSACAQLGELEKGKKVHDYIERNRIRVDSFLSTGLVDFYAKCGCIDTALEVFELSSDKSLITWNAMLVGIAMHGHGQLLLNYFSRMINAEVKPDGVTFLAVFVGCSHGGLVNEARKLFDEMECVYGVSRELKHYGCMADLLGRAGMIKETMEMTKGLPMGGDMFVWSGLLGGCRIHGNVEIAEKAAKQVMELKPEDGGVYSILASVYANAERWEDVVKIRRLMSGNKVVKKNSGRSLIQLDGVMHEFLAGDSSHARTDEMHMILEGFSEHQCEVW
ncbi:pentatricopeptide repeat-containing protein At5g61800 [Mercurialis annua]|uniref:pentatricopeptide repeat-containing protein At5g61800 n=1 Tax=Mercurialis annua TaxID=3986 RepID=UPI00215E6C9D|nr:pentatricopeptide repeat-containing protein At5g61800 [Mercurialis annua]